MLQHWQSWITLFQVLNAIINFIQSNIFWNYVASSLLLSWTSALCPNLILLPLSCPLALSMHVTLYSYSNHFFCPWRILNKTTWKPELLRVQEQREILAPPVKRPFWLSFPADTLGATIITYFQQEWGRDFLLLSGLLQKRHRWLFWELWCRGHCYRRGGSDHKASENRSWLHNVSRGRSGGGKRLNLWVIPGGGVWRTWQSGPSLGHLNYPWGRPTVWTQRQSEKS